MLNQQGKPGRFLQFLRQKGYYMVLIVCIAAVGVSGWIFLRTLNDTPAEDVLGEEVSVSIPAKPDIPEPITANENEAEEPQREPEQEEKPTQPQKPESKMTALRPVTGETVQAHSMDSLVYNATMRDWRTHDGMDIACGVGTQVRAAMAGTVERVYDDDFLGTVVQLQHEGGYTTVYANLTGMPTVSEGDSVQAGQVIGAVGTTALGESAQTAHLHFAVQKNGQSIDPESIFD